MQLGGFFEGWFDAVISIRDPKLVYSRVFEITLEVDQVFETYMDSERGEATTRCRWTNWVWEITGLDLGLHENYRFI